MKVSDEKARLKTAPSKKKALPLEGKQIKVKIVAEAAGIAGYGKEGLVSEAALATKKDSDFIDVFVDGMISVKVSFIQKLDPAWKTPEKWKTFQSLSRFQKASLLDAAGLLPAPFYDNTDTLLETPLKDDDMSEQHLELAAWLFQWSFPTYMEEVELLETDSWIEGS